MKHTLRLLACLILMGIGPHAGGQRPPRREARRPHGEPPTLTGETEIRSGVKLPNRFAYARYRIRPPIAFASQREMALARLPSMSDCCFWFIVENRFSAARYLLFKLS